MVYKQGMASATDPTTGEGRPESWAESIAYLYPSENPFVILLDKIGTETVDDPVYHMFTDEPQELFVATDASATSGDTTISVDDGSGGNGGYAVVEGDVLYCKRTGEQMVATADGSAGSITVTRSAGTTAAAGLNDNDILYIVGNVQEEGFTTGTAISSTPDNQKNYLQNLHEPIKVSDDVDLTTYRWGDEEARQVKLAGKRFYRKLERILLFQERHTDTKNGETRRYTGGLRYWLTTNVEDVSGNITESLLDQYLQKIFMYTEGNEIVGLAGGYARMYINQVMKSSGSIELDVESNRYGLNGTTYVTPFGDLTLVTHKAMQYSQHTVDTVVGSTQNNSLSGDVFLIDPQKIGLVWGEGFEEDIRRDIAAKTFHGKMHEFYGKPGLWMEHEKHHGLWLNITGSA